AVAIDSASMAMRSGNAAERSHALAEVAACDAELVSGSLTELRRIDAQRTSVERHDRLAADLVTSARAQFAVGDQALPLRRRAEFDPPHDLVSSALADLRDEADKQVKEAAERRQAEAQIAAAHADFAAGHRSHALAALTGSPHAALVAGALAELSAADAAI